MTSDNADFEAELRSLVAGGRKLEAIKRYRERTGAGLAEAKAAVEALERGETPPAEESADVEITQEIVSLLGSGKKVEAIKLYRERTGAGLKQAKEAVEAIAAERHMPVPSGGGCLGVVLVVTAILTACLVWCSG